MTLGTKIVVLKGGHIQQVGSPKEIYDQPANMFVANFMGTPPMNLFPAAVTVSGNMVTLKVGDEKEGFTLIDAKAATKLAAYDGKTVVVGLRPEAVITSYSIHYTKLYEARG